MDTNKNKMLKILFLILAILSLIFLFYYFNIPSIISKPLTINKRITTSDAILILAHESKNDKLSDQSLARVNHAVDLYSQNYSNLLIVSGGNRDNEYCVAELMKEYLIERGIDERNIIIETKSKNTYENLLNSHKIINKNNLKNIIIVTSPYHSFRVSRIAKELGINFSISFNKNDPTLNGKIDTKFDSLIWVLREYFVIIYFDIFYSKISYFLIVLLFIWLLIILFKLYDMVVNNFVWCIKNGEKYHFYLSTHGDLTEDIINFANEKFGRRHLKISHKIQNIKKPLGDILSFIFRFPCVFMITALLLGLLVFFEQPKFLIISLIIILLLGLLIQLALRLINRLYLGSSADIDDSIQYKIKDISKNQKWLQALAFRRITTLFIIDIFVLLFCFSFIYFGLNYCYNGFSGIESSNKFKQLIDFCYYSIVTFTTTGFGDIKPKSGSTITKVLTIIQLIFSFLYIVTIVFLLSVSTKAKSISTNNR